MSNLYLEHKAVVGVVEAQGETFFLDGVEADLVAHVDEVGGNVAEASAEGYGVFHGLMRLVRCMAQGSDDEQLNVFY